MTKNASRFSCVMAMVGASAVCSSKFSEAYSAATVLFKKSRSEEFSRKTGSYFSLGGKFGGPNIGVFIPMFLFSQASLNFCFICFAVKAALSQYFGLSVMRRATGFYLWALVVFTKSLSLVINIRKATKFVIFEVLRPFFWRAVSFYHSRSLNTCVV